MADFTVNSTLCGFVHKIHGEMKGDRIFIDIDTPCAKVKKMSHMEVPMMGILDIRDNYVIERAHEADCSANCIVPCAILNLCRMESGFLAKSLVKKSGGLSIEFNEV